MPQGTCSFDDCHGSIRARGMCSTHYYRTLRSEKEQLLPECTESGCVEKVHSRGLCRTHYNAANYRSKEPCSVDGCGIKAHCRGYCYRHYYRAMRGLPMDAERLRIRVKADEQVCTVEGCEQPHMAKRLCNKHYIRFIKHGDASAILKRKRGSANLCEIESCSHGCDVDGLCHDHAAAWSAARRWSGTTDAGRATRGTWSSASAPITRATAVAGTSQSIGS